MATWKVQSSDGQQWTIEAPEGVTEAEVNEFVAANADSWVSGGHYKMEEAGEADEKKPDAASLAVPFARTPKNIEAAAAEASLSRQIEEATAEHAKTPSRVFGGPSGELGPATGFAVQPGAKAKQQVLRDEIKELEKQKERVSLGTTGQTVGGLTGALGGGGLGILVGMPFGGPPGMVIGGALGSILGGAYGAAKGTQLWDIPEARQAMDISDADAAALIRSRGIESLIWDGAFVLLLGPGGRIIGKLTKGEKFLPALKASVKQAFAWDDIVKSKEAQLSEVARERGTQATKGLATQASKALDLPRPAGDVEAATALVEDIARRSGGRVPTLGEMEGIVGRSEGFARRLSPRIFFENERALAETAEEIRQTAFRDLDAVGAFKADDLGEAVTRVGRSAITTLKRITGPTFERAAQQNVAVDFSAVKVYVDDVLKRDTASLGRLLPGPGERASLEEIQKGLTTKSLVGPFFKSPAAILTPEAAQDFISGNKAAMRELATGGVKPSKFINDTLRDLNGIADGAYLDALRKVDDPELAKDLLGARKLYRETMTDVFSDTMSKLARTDPEDFGRVLVPKGAVTQLRELRTALDRALQIAPKKGRARVAEGEPRILELGKKEVIRDRARIDAGLLKGFIEKHTQSLTDLPGKMADPDFRLTLKELLTGAGVADPALGKKVLSELDRVMGVLNLIKPELAPQPGKIGLIPGMGGFGTGTLAAGVTGQGIGPISIGAVLATGFGLRLLTHAMANAMTTGNIGIVRSIQRAVALTPAASANAVAAQTMLGILRELDAWDKQNGGDGLPELKQFPLGSTVESSGR